MNQSSLVKAEKNEKRRMSVLSSQVKFWYSWFKEGQFYVYGLVYTAVRVAVNVVMSVQAFYIIIVLKVP